MTEAKEIRRFGIIALIFFGSLFALGLGLNKPLPTYLFGALCLPALGFILAPALLTPLYAGWLKIAHFVGRVMTTIILACVYYVVMTPAALIKRIISGPPLPLKPDKGISTYWVTRSETAQPSERFLKRF